MYSYTVDDIMAGICHAVKCKLTRIRRMTCNSCVHNPTVRKHGEYSSKLGLDKFEVVRELCGSFLEVGMFIYKGDTIFVLTFKTNC